MKQTIGESFAICSYQSELIVFKYGLGYTTLKNVIHRKYNHGNYFAKLIKKYCIKWNALNLTEKKFVKTHEDNWEYFHQFSSPKWLIFVCELLVMIFHFYLKSHERCCLCNSGKKIVKSIGYFFSWNQFCFVLPSGRICLPVP